MDLPKTCPCGGAYAYQNDRLVCSVCGVPAAAAAPRAKPRKHETAAGAALHQAEDAWAEYEARREHLVELRIQLNAELKELAAKTEDSRLRLHQADSQLVALDRTKGALHQELQSCRRDADAEQARRDRERRIAAINESAIAERRAAELDTEAAIAPAAAAEVKPPVQAPEPTPVVPEIAPAAEAAQPVQEPVDAPPAPPARNGRRR